jgi:hypothetical protein
MTQPDKADRPDGTPQFEVSRQMVYDLAQTLPRLANEPEVARRERAEAVARRLLAAFRPRDAVEAMLASQVIATHAAIMDSFRLALACEASEEMARRQRSCAIALMRCMAETMRALERRQGRKLPAPHEVMGLPKADLAALVAAPAAQPQRVQPGPSGDALEVPANRVLH